MGKKILLAAILVLALASCGRKTSSDKQETPIPKAVEDKKDTRRNESIDRAIKEISDLAPERRPGVLVCPFTDSAGTITADSLALYFPTLYKISYCPGRLINTPFDGYVLSSASEWGFLNPGRKISLEDLKVLVRIFGCSEYVTGTVEPGDSTMRVTMTIHREGGRSLEKTASVPVGESHRLPTQIAAVILEEMTGRSLPKENKAYLDIPAAKNAALLREAGMMSLQSYTDPGKMKWQDYAALLEKDPDMDWFVPIYLNAQTLDDSILAIVGEYEGKCKDRPRFALMYAGFLNKMWQNDRAILKAAEAIRKMPDCAKAYEVLGLAVQNLRNPGEAAPFFDRMLQLSPDNAWCLYAMGSHRIDLAWHHRGSGLASSVTEQGFKDFYKCLQEAKGFLEKCADLDPKKVGAWSELITVGMGLDFSSAEIRVYFDKAVSVNPNYREAYYRMQNALLPKWGGSIPELNMFWNEMLTRDCQNHYVYTVIPYGSWVLSLNYSHDNTGKTDWKKQKEFLSASYIWPFIERAYEKFFSGEFEDYEQRAVYGFMASSAGKYDLGFKQYELSKMKFTGEEWFQYHDMLRHYSYCALKTGNYDRAIEAARKGMECNHCPSCNGKFQEYINFASKKMKK